MTHTTSAPALPTEPGPLAGTMQAFTTGGDGIAALRLEERPTPAPGPGEILVRMTAASLNYRDLLVINGTAAWKPAEPRIPVSDGVGVVEAVGGGVSRFCPGDRVAGIFLPRWLEGELTPEKHVLPLGGAAADGVLAEYRVFPEQAAVRVPGHLTEIEAAALPVAALTAWHAVHRRSRVQAGDTVLIQGTGGVSLFATQFVHAIGGRPIVISSSDEKLERARALGAAETVNYRTTPAWEDAVLALTDGRGVDHVIEVVGGENLNRSLRAVRLSGTISFIGLIAGLSAPIDTWQFVAKNVQLHGIETGSREMFEEMNRFISTHRLRPVIDRIFSFAEFPEAMRHLESGRHFGKVAIAF
jgi:NADPH:quinone reductase-like Zn-dependent oxidoreductase